MKLLLNKPCDLPNLKSAIDDGAIVEITCSTGDTSTKPGWAQILTGYDPEYMGVYANGCYTAIPEGYTVFERANAFFGEENVFTFMITAKKANLGSLGPDNTGDPAMKPQPYYNTVKSIDVWHGDKFRKMDEVRSIGLSVLTDYINNHINEHCMGFIHFIEPDSQGHTYGEYSIEYSQAIINLDKILGEFIALLKEHNLYDDTLLYITTDHGFDEKSVPFPVFPDRPGHKHKSAPYIYLASNKRSLQ